jgi:DNA helicase-2/ATP-dependent DNA helicase PcrA
VFLIGLEEEILPHARTLAPRATDVIDQESATDIDEERRLAYVGITRARDVLYLTRCTHRLQRGKMVPRTPSRFLAEIPTGLMTIRDLSAEEEQPVAQEALSSFFARLSE